MALLDMKKKEIKMSKCKLCSEVKKKDIIICNGKICERCLTHLKSANIETINDLRSFFKKEKKL